MALSLSLRGTREPLARTGNIEDFKNTYTWMWNTVPGTAFGGTTAFLMGNEGHGLTEAQLAACDQTVYIPQHSGATASLNVNAATACVLSCFAHAVGYAEERRRGAKFEVRDPLHALWRPKS